nr:type I polyketide synthase [Polyangium spumosum]
MRAKIESIERARIEPIAIIGMGCRFPGGANTPEAFFRLLEDGVDTIREVPPERWSLEQEGQDMEAEAGALRWGSFLDGVDRFDATFFGISPREAESLDPQQRLLLEVAWEALERAGQLPERLMGSRTGVYIGIWALDYQQRVLALSPDKLDAYSFTGNALSTAAGRLSYVLGLQGPAMSVETACSSSLTAIHLACQSLRNGESNLALAGGVNLMLSPATTKLLSKTQALSPDGRCKTFDARANGFVRGEGCGIVVLKRLSDAERDGDPIIAVIRGSAVNQDGRSTGLTAPNVLSQQTLLRQALESARVAPSDVGYVEAHGTGTSLGDPIEVEALKAVLGGPREKGSTCILGAVKTNIGHLEAAAGVAGLMKVALSLQNERIPGNLHFRSLNPRIDLRGTSLEIAQNPVPWKPGLRPRIGGVSSFGISGTNAHVVLEEAPRNLEEILGREASAYLLPLSAKTPEALLDLARSYHRFLLSADGPRLLDIAYTASVRRSHFEHRLALVGGTRAELAASLAAILRGDAPVGVVRGKATPARAKAVFVFSGQGSQWLGMGRKLYEEESAFRSVFDSCDALLTGRLGWSILDELDSVESMSRMSETHVAQPLIFSLQVALVELLRSWGIAPDAVIGHGVGEIAAAYIAGILSLDEAIRLVAIRGRIMQKATDAAKMVSIAAPLDVARKAIAGYEDRLIVGAIDDPGSCVLAGQVLAMDEVVAQLERRGVSCRALPATYTYQGPHMDGVAQELMERLVRVDARRATLAMYSTVLAECVEGKELDVRYWGRNVRETVDLAGAVGAAIHDGYQLFLEVGPDPVLVDHLRQCIAAKGVEGGLAVASLQRDRGDRRALLEATGALYTRGCSVEWLRLVPQGGRPVLLPTYPWQQERYWVETPQGRAVGHGADARHALPRPRQRARVVFVFPGQGSQWVGMGKQLLAEEPVFRASIESSDAAIQKEAGISVLAELHADESRSRLAEVDVVQPVLFAVEVALAALWRSRGLRPDCVIGHSMGEVAAAHVAGALGLEDAVGIICRRSRLLRRVSGKGAMALVELSIEDAVKALAGYEDRLSVAVSNGPRATVIAGEPGALDIVLSNLEKSGIYCRRVKVDVASHSPQVDPLREDLLAALSELRPGRAKIRMCSTVTGDFVAGAELVPSYWVKNLRAPVLFSQVTRMLIDEGHTIFVEMSPHPILLPSIEENLREKRREGAALPSMRREADARRTLEEALAVLRERGALGEARAGDADGGAAGADHEAIPLLGTKFRPFAQASTHYWEGRLGLEKFPWLGDHRVHDAVVFPGAGYVEMALEAISDVFGGEQALLEGISFEHMLALRPEVGRVVQVSLVDEGGRRASLVIGSREQGEDRWVRHATALVRMAATTDLDEASLPLRRIASQCVGEVDPAQHYARMGERGLRYGPSFRGIRRISLGEGEVLGHVRLPEEQSIGTYHAHPALLDACFQLATALLPSAHAGETYLPVRIARIGVHHRLSREAWVHARRAPASEADTGVVDVDLVVTDEAGRLLLDVRGLRLQRIDALPAKDPFDDCVFVVEWRRKDLEGSSRPLPGRGAWIVFLDGAGTGARVAKLLRERGERCVEVGPGLRFEHVGTDSYRLDATDSTQLRRLLDEAFGRQQPCKGVVHCHALDAAPWERTSGETLMQEMRAGALSVVRIVQALLRQGWRDAPRLFLVTRGAQAVWEGQKSVSVAQAPLWGLGRTLALEHPELECTRIDLDPSGDAGDGSLLVREFFDGDGEDQVALRSAGRFVARLVRGKIEQGDPSLEQRRQEAARGRPFRLEIHKPGILDVFDLREVERRPPGPGEVEIDVEAAGLNFLDVLLAMGVLPDDVAAPAEAGLRLGVECAGRVVALGEGVTDFEVGQEVMALGPASMATHVRTSRHLVLPKPSHVRWEEAATTPVAFLTAYHSLAHVARLRRGERVLIHAGAGGVGMAAIQWAKHVGAEIFATAGSEEKRALLRVMGVHHVMDSRSLSFVDDVHHITGGEGIDVVLNSLSGEFIEASFGLLRDHGRFIELGKKDYYENRTLGVRPFLKNLSFSLVDLRGMMFQRPAMVAELLREVRDQFAAGVFAPLPCRAFPVSRASEAFAFMAQGRHTGKLAILLQDPDARIATSSTRVRLREDAAYLVTGGLGGLGVVLAQWMVKQGARHLALVGRSAPADVAQAAIREMEAAGAEVRVIRADVSRRVDVDALLADLRGAMPPLRGIVHAAAVLDDRTLADMGEEQWTRPIAPKALGAWNLHEATRGLPLDFFIMYSSVAGLLGTAGQAGYAGANAFLDALCQARAAQGLPGMSIQWGPFAGVGLAAAQDNRGERLSAQGMSSFTAEEGLRLLGRLMEHPKVEVGLVRFAVRQWMDSYPQAAGTPFLRVLSEERAGPAAARDMPFRETLDRAPSGERAALLEKLVIEHLGRVVRMEPSRIERAVPFAALGVDSLMSLELRNRLEAALGVRLSATLLFTYPNPAALAEYLLRQLEARASPVEPPPLQPEPEPLEPIPDTARTGHPIPAQDDDLIAAFDASVRDLKTEKSP